VRDRNQQPGNRGLGDAVAVLRRARFRWFMHQTARSLIVALGVAGVTRLALGVIHAAGLSGGLAGLWNLTIIVFMAFVLTASIILALALRRSPSLVTLARRVDRNLGLHDRLSTALEVSANSESYDTIVGAAAVKDAERHARGIQVRDAVRFQWPRYSWLLPILIPAAVAVHVSAAPFTPDRSMAVSSDPNGSAVVAAPDMAALAEALQRIARVIEDDPASEDSDYLRAIAREFDDLSQRARLGTGGPNDVEQRFRELSQHLGRALEGEPASALHQLANALQEYGEAGGPADAVGAAQEVAGAVATAHEDRNSDELATDRGHSPSQSADHRAFEDALRQLSDALGTIEAESEERERARQDAEGTPTINVVADGADDAHEESTWRPGDFAQDAGAAGVPIGAAENADDAPGDAAGGGLQREGDGEPPFDGAAMDTSVGDPLLLAENDDEFDGPIVQVGPGVHMVSRGAAESPSTLPPLVNMESEDGSVTREAVGAAYRIAVSRYFSPERSQLSLASP